MKNNNFYYEIIIFSICLLLLDIPFISLIMSERYNKIFKSLNLVMKPKLIFALLAYLIMISGYILIKDKDNNINSMIMRAGLLGFVVYGTYGFTLATILPNYNLSDALLETFWGTFVYMMATLLSFRIIEYSNDYH